MALAWLIWLLYRQCTKKLTGNDKQGKDTENDRFAPIEILVRQ